MPYPLVWFLQNLFRLIYELFRQKSKNFESWKNWKLWWLKSVFFEKKGLNFFEAFFTLCEGVKYEVAGNPFIFYFIILVPVTLKTNNTWCREVVKYVGWRTQNCNIVMEFELFTDRISNFAKGRKARRNSETENFFVQQNQIPGNQVK